jgi:hypothetical protein
VRIGTVKARYWTLVAASAVTATVFLAIARSSPYPDVEIAFLADKTPVRNEEFELGWEMRPVDPESYSTGAPASLQRVKDYVFVGRYKEVIESARKELLPKGAVETENTSEETAFDVADTWYLYIHPGRFDPTTDTIEPSAPYVHVNVVINRDENAFGIARRWLRSHIP